MPTAPVPAKRSSHTVPPRRSGSPPVKTSKSVSRRRSEVGRRSRPFSERRGRPRNLPAITRMSFPRAQELASSGARLRVYTIWRACSAVENWERRTTRFRERGAGMSGRSRIGLLLCAALILSLSAAAFGETLGDVLQQHGLPITPALHNREKSITSYAALDNDKVFVIGYYLDDGSGSLKEPLFVSRFDKGAREWKSSGILTRDLQGGGTNCLGSVTSVRVVQSSSSFLYLDTHINPSAGC